MIQSVLFETVQAKPLNRCCLRVSFINKRQNLDEPVTSGLWILHSKQTKAYLPKQDLNSPEHGCKDKIKRNHKYKSKNIELKTVFETSNSIHSEKLKVVDLKYVCGVEFHMALVSRRCYQYISTPSDYLSLVAEDDVVSVGLRLWNDSEKARLPQRNQARN
jgi:hypothetical protein